MYLPPKVLSWVEICKLQRPENMPELERQPESADVLFISLLNSGTVIVLLCFLLCKKELNEYILNFWSTAEFHQCRLYH